MKKAPKISYARILWMTLVLVFVLSLLVILLFAGLKRTQKKFSQSQDILAAQVVENERLLQTLVGEVALQGEMSAEALNSALSSVNQEIDSVTQELVRVESSSAENVSALEAALAAAEGKTRTVIETWLPRVARVTCRIPSDSGGDPDDSVTNASGTLFTIDGTRTIVTNAHAIDNNAKNPQASELCKVRFDGQDEGDAYQVQQSRLTLFDEDVFDLGLMDVGSLLTNHTGVSTNRGLCTHSPKVGDDIIVLGYPKIGAQESVTITEGVIAGFEENYYVTSANIGSGSSGGAAIDVERNCYLGIPTFTRIDRTGALGRILEVRSFDAPE